MELWCHGWLIHMHTCFFFFFQSSKQNNVKQCKCLVHNHNKKSVSWDCLYVKTKIKIHQNCVYLMKIRYDQNVIHKRRLVLLPDFVGESCCEIQICERIHKIVLVCCWFWSSFCQRTKALMKFRQVKRTLWARYSWYRTHLFWKIRWK